MEDLGQKGRKTSIYLAVTPRRCIVPKGYKFVPHFPMVAMTASALVGITSEPSRAHAVDLVMLGQQLAGKLVRDGVCALASDFALVWRDHVVPVAAASRTDWQAGMCAEVTGLTSDSGKPFNNIVGRIRGQAPPHPDGVRWELLISTPDGIGILNLLPVNLKATAKAAAVLTAAGVEPLRLPWRSPSGLPAGG